MDSVYDIREPRDQRLFDSFPGLFAAFHALHRLLAPRHPPHALSNLTTMILASNTPRLLPADRDAFNMQSFFLPGPP
jgi:hypothetical protein